MSDSERAQLNVGDEREPISAFVICFNECEEIKECLESLSFCDEIVVVDSFSTDSTPEIARTCGARVIQRQWTGYRDQKAFGLTNVKHEWVINLDADERVSHTLRENILSVLRQARHNTAGNEVVGYYVNRVVFFLNRWWRSGGWYPEYRLRFFRKSRVVWGGVEPHEKPIPDGRTETLPGEIYHFTYRNLDEQISQLHRFSTIAANEDFKAGKRTTVVSLIFNPLIRMLKFYFFKKGYREGRAGLIVAINEGFYTFMKYAKLWEHEYNARKSEEDERRA